MSMFLKPKRVENKFKLIKLIEINYENIISEVVSKLKESRISNDYPVYNNLTLSMGNSEMLVISDGDIKILFHNTQILPMFINLCRSEYKVFTHLNWDQEFGSGTLTETELAEKIVSKKPNEYKILENKLHKIYVSDKKDITCIEERLEIGDINNNNTPKESPEQMRINGNKMIMDGTKMISDGEKIIAIYSMNDAKRREGEKLVRTGQSNIINGRSLIEYSDKAPEKKNDLQQSNTQVFNKEIIPKEYFYEIYGNGIIKLFFCKTDNVYKIKYYLKKNYSDNQSIMNILNSSANIYKSYIDKVYVSINNLMNAKSHKAPKETLDTVEAELWPLINKTTSNIKKIYNFQVNDVLWMYDQYISVINHKNTFNHDAYFYYRLNITDDCCNKTYEHVLNESSQPEQKVVSSIESRSHIYRPSIQIKIDGMQRLISPHPNTTWNLRHRGGIESTEMGLGKTLIMIMFIYYQYSKVESTKKFEKVRRLVHEGELSYYERDIWYLKTKASLVILPDHLIDQWVKEITTKIANPGQVIVIKNVDDINVKIGHIMIAKIVILALDVFHKVQMTPEKFPLKYKKIDLNNLGNHAKYKTFYENYDKDVVYPNYLYEFQDSYDEMCITERLNQMDKHAEKITFEQFDIEDLVTSKPGQSEDLKVEQKKFLNQKHCILDRVQWLNMIIDEVDVLTYEFLQKKHTMDSMMYWIISGTPLVNNMDSLIKILLYICPDDRIKFNNPFIYEKFMFEFGNKKNSNTSLINKLDRMILSGINPEIFDVIKPFCRRNTRESIKDEYQPTKVTKIPIYIELSPGEQNIYNIFNIDTFPVAISHILKLSNGITNMVPKLSSSTNITEEKIINELINNSNNKINVLMKQTKTTWGKAKLELKKIITLIIRICVNHAIPYNKAAFDKDHLGNNETFDRIVENLCRDSDGLYKKIEKEFILEKVDDNVFKEITAINIDDFTNYIIQTTVCYEQRNQLVGNLSNINSFIKSANITLPTSKKEDTITLANTLPINIDTYSFNNNIVDKSYFIPYSTKLSAVVLFTLNNFDRSEKKVIFSQHDESIELLSNKFTELGVKFASCISSIEIKNKAIEDFKNPNSDVNILLISSLHTAAGADLYQATICIKIELPYGNKLMMENTSAQADGRIFRITQEKDVTIYTFIVRNTIEEELYDAYIRGIDTDYNWDEIVNILNHNYDS